MTARVTGLTADAFAGLAAEVMSEWLEGYFSVSFEDGPETQYRAKYLGDGVYTLEERAPFNFAPTTRKFRVTVTAEEVEE